MKPVTIQFNKMNFHNDLNSDCGGFGFEWKCPDCGEKVTWAPSAWWKLECKCRNWELEIEAKGSLKEDVDKK